MIQQIKVWFRKFIVTWYIRTNEWAVPRVIYTAIDNYDVDTAQQMLEHQANIWGVNDLAVMRAQSYIDLL